MPRASREHGRPVKPGHPLIPVAECCRGRSRLRGRDNLPRPSPANQPPGPDAVLRSEGPRGSTRDHVGWLGVCVVQSSTPIGIQDKKRGDSGRRHRARGPPTGGAHRIAHGHAGGKGAVLSRVLPDPDYRAGSSTPGPLASFPGAYLSSDLGILVKLQSIQTYQYIPPGPEAWSG
ncbi:hypothetical protein F4775DRAFT_588692 [Biscogniauxia sp. FL1348]|nr:hypothetical protein F4775DRAFT_588692 [Biscogniauxia sp. FL1348]